MGRATAFRDHGWMHFCIAVKPWCHADEEVLLFEQVYNESYSILDDLHLGSVLRDCLQTIQHAEIVL